MVDFDISRAAALGDVPHGFFAGGGRFQFGYGGPGELKKVFDWRAAAANAIVTGGTISAPHQVHSTDVITVTKPWLDHPEGRPVADAVVTDQVGIVLGIVTADCAPVLFADREAGVVGAAHAGWRGAQGGVLENTIAAMEQFGATASKIVAAIGPTIGQASYEVDATFRKNFDAGDDTLFEETAARDGKERWLFDLPSYVTQRLGRAGISAVENLEQDTFAADPRYYSYRRATQAGEPNYGRQISMIAIG